MDVRTYEIALLASYIYRCSQSDIPAELEAVGCALRNRVQKFGSYTAMFNAIPELQGNPLRDYPATNSNMFDPMTGLLELAERVYTNELPDVTSTHDHPDGAVLFCQPNNPHLSPQFVLLVQDYDLLGTWVNQQFFGHKPVPVIPVFNPMDYANDVRTFAHRTLQPGEYQYN